MRIPRITINTSVLASLVGVHAVEHVDVGAFYFVHQAFCLLLQVLRFLFTFGYLPFVVLLFKTVDGIELRAAAINYLHRYCVFSFTNQPGKSSCDVCQC